MSKIKILVCTHKPDKVFSNEVYTPIQVGKEISQYDLGILGDNTGDNISHLNPYYCELTAQYWAWKNLDCEYIGLAHYRRYFNYVYTENNIESIFKNCDIVLARPIVRSLPLSDKIKEMISEHVITFLTILENLYPEYKQTAIDYIYNNNKDICFNMFVCKKNIFDDYAKWEFSILQECQKYIKLSGYKNSDRLYGCFGEYMLPIYAIHNKLKIKYNDVISFPVDGKIITNQSWISKWFNVFRFRLNHIHKVKDYQFPKAILLGMKSMPELNDLFLKNPNNGKKNSF